MQASASGQSVNSSGGPKVKWGAWIPLPVPVQDVHACCHLNSLSVSYLSNLISLSGSSVVKVKYNIIFVKKLSFDRSTLLCFKAVKKCCRAKNQGRRRDAH